MERVSASHRFAHALADASLSRRHNKKVFSKLNTSALLTRARADCSSTDGVTILKEHEKIFLNWLIF